MNESSSSIEILINRLIRLMSVIVRTLHTNSIHPIVSYCTALKNTTLYVLCPRVCARAAVRCPMFSSPSIYDIIVQLLDNDVSYYVVHTVRYHTSIQGGINFDQHTLELLSILYLPVLCCLISFLNLICYPP